MYIRITPLLDRRVNPPAETRQGSERLNSGQLPTAVQS